jgi:hypothetical protein
LRPGRRGCRAAAPRVRRPTQLIAGKAERRIRYDADQRDRENQKREGQEDIHGAGDKGVRPAAEIASDNTKENADHDGEGGGEKPDQERVPGAIDHSAQHVTASNWLNAEGMSGADPAEWPVRATEGRVDQAGVIDVGVLHQVGADDRDQDKQRHDDAPRYGNLVMPKPKPGDPAW